MEKVQRYSRLRDFVTYIFLILVILFAQPTPRFLVVGSIFFVFGLIIRILAAGTLVRIGEMVTGGIYQMTRNPLYLGGLFSNLGLTIMSADPVLILLYFIIFIPMVNTVINLEEGFLESAFGRDFAEYKQKVPRLLPTTGAPPGLGVNFSIKRYWLNREFFTNIVLVIFAVLIWLKYYYEIPLFPKAG